VIVVVAVAGVEDGLYPAGGSVLDSRSPDRSARWPETWPQIPAIACGALDALREEVHAGISGS